MITHSDALAAYQATKDPELKCDLILQYAPLVKYIAGRLAMFLPPSVEVADLVNDGIIGLIDALEKFDLKRGVEFKDYARLRIRGAMIDALRALDWMPRSMRRTTKQLDKARQELEKELGRTPKKDEIAKKMNLSIAQVEHYYHTFNESYIISLDELQQNSDLFEPRMSNLTCSEILDTYEQAEREIRKKILLEALTELPDREQLILSLYYIEGLTVREIKMVMGISEARISQLHTRSLRRLKEKLACQFKEN